MEIKTVERKGIQVAGSAIKSGGQMVKASHRFLRTGLTASVEGGEEEQGTQQGGIPAVPDWNKIKRLPPGRKLRYLRRMEADIKGYGAVRTEAACSGLSPTGKDRNGAYPEKGYRSSGSYGSRNPERAGSVYGNGRNMPGRYGAAAGDPPGIRKAESGREAFQKKENGRDPVSGSPVRNGTAEGPAAGRNAAPQYGRSADRYGRKESCGETAAGRAAAMENPAMENTGGCFGGDYTTLEDPAGENAVPQYNGSAGGYRRKEPYGETAADRTAAGGNAMPQTGGKPLSGERAAAYGKAAPKNAAAAAAAAPAAAAAAESIRMAGRTADKIQSGLAESMEQERLQLKAAQKQQEERMELAAGRKEESTDHTTAILIVIAVFLCIFLPVMAVWGGLFPSENPSAGRIVEAAEAELAESDSNVGGYKYKEWYGMDANWCAMFVSWCADQCGYIEDGVMPKTASVSVMEDWYQARGLFHDAAGYVPRPGDIIFFGNGMSHTGIVTAYDPDTGTVTTIEGNTGSSDTSPYHIGSCVKECRYAASYGYIVGYGSPEYPEDETGTETSGSKKETTAYRIPVRCFDGKEEAA